jgi:hypothetical protein
MRRLTHPSTQRHSRRFMLVRKGGYSAGMFTARTDCHNEDWVAWSYTGTMSARGSCQQTDDRRRLDENICCSVKRGE